MKKIVLLLIILAVASLAKAQGQIAPEHFATFRDLIRDFGYQCNTCEGGHFMDESYKGKLFRVYCNENSLQYRVVLNPNKGTACVEPWDAKTPMCDR